MNNIRVIGVANSNITAFTGKEKQIIQAPANKVTHSKDVLNKPTNALGKGVVNFLKNFAEGLEMMFKSMHVKP